MIKFLADENLIHAIFLGVRRAQPSIDFVRAQDVGLQGVGDEEVLEWAANEGRIVVTHDVTTMYPLACERIARGLPMAGLIEIGSNISIRTAIDDLFLIAFCSDGPQWSGQIIFLPL